jgi:hypothetical protein
MPTIYDGHQQVGHRRSRLTSQRAGSVRALPFEKANMSSEMSPFLGASEEARRTHLIGADRAANASFAVR